MKLNATLVELGFTKYITEHALYKRRLGKEHLIVDVYVDDLVITGAWGEDIDGFKDEMVARFHMSDLGLVTYYLGIEVKQRTPSPCANTCTQGSYWGRAAWRIASRTQLRWRRG